MTWNYNHKTALVTGASSGIGEVFARQLARKGTHLILVARSEHKLEQLARELRAAYSVQAVVIPADLTDKTAVVKLQQEVQNLGLTVDILINNAGFGSMGIFDQIQEERLLREIQLNVTALTELTHAFITPMLQRQSGVIINVASMTAFQPAPFMAVYGATKAYVLSFTEALWAEYRDSGVRIVALCPGETKSAFHGTSGSDTLTGKRMEPLEVVNAAFEAVEQDRSYRIAGRNNYLMAQFPRFLPRRMVLNAAKRMLQPVIRK
ncbi:SDR family oxidoreductase [Paenibacillus sp. S150]|nr:SDR family oxidoreductase [Paenibacillus sp. S150]